MFSREYRFRFYLNARHTMNINDNRSKIHPHTWEFVMYMEKYGDDFIQFSDIEREIQGYLSKYENTFLNEVPPFDMINPSMEGIGEFFFQQVSERLHKCGWRLKRLEISENPTRTYIIKGNNEMRGSADSNNYSSSQPLSTQMNRPLVSQSEPAAPVERDAAPPEARGELNPASPEEPDGAGDEDGTWSEETDSNEETASKSENYEEADGDERFIGKNAEKKGIERFFDTRYIFISALVIAAFSIITILLVTRNGINPWGSDTWGHLYKTHILYNEVKAGNYYPLYSGDWYNGTQPFRYWAPLPYYIMLLFLFLTGGNVVYMYNIFIAFIFVAGAFGWVLWGVKTGRKKLALVFAVLWFFIPDNLRVLFSEGNIPRVVVSALFPYFLLGVWDYLENNNKRSLIVVFVCVILTTLCHAMISAMVCITIFIFAVCYGAINKKGNALGIILVLILGVAASGIWLFPALKGGMLSLSEEAVLEAVRMQTQSLFQSLNPLLRFRGNKEAFYYGTSFVFISVFGLLFSNRKSRVGFGIMIMILLGTTKALFPVIAKIPMSQLFWMWRFTPLAIGIFLSAMMFWKNIRKEVLVAFLVMMVIDCMSSFNLLGYGVQETDMKKELDTALAVASQRIAILDISRFGSFPSYYINYNDDGKQVGQVFGWASQGAKTMPNLVWLNTALEKGWYSFLFDRCLELGSDTLVVRKDIIKDAERLLNEARNQGYETIGEGKHSIVLKYPADYSFATTASYNALGIGRYAGNISFVFPMFEIGGSIYLDDYSEEELLEYKVVYLSGFKYRDKSAAESMVQKLSLKGVRFIIDMTGAEVDIYTSRASFLQVAAQPVEFLEKYPLLKMGGREYETAEMPESNSRWRTIYLENVDYVYGSANFNEQGMNFLGSKLNDNIIFIGFNLPYFAVETGDSTAIGILEEVIGLPAYKTPQREVVKMNIANGNNSIKIETGKEGVITGVACLDAFKVIKGETKEVHNLVLLKGRELEIAVGYPYLLQGLVLTLTGLSGFIFYYKGRGRIREQESLSA